MGQPNETITNATCTKCQHCGRWTNFADQPHYRALVDRLTLSDSEIRIVEEVSKNEMLGPLYAKELLAIIERMAIDRDECADTGENDEQRQ